MTNKQEAAEPPETLGDRFRDAIAPRTLVLGLGVLPQFGFIPSYIGAVHAPAPHRIPVTVVAEPVLPALDGHLWSIACIGVLVSLSAATVTIALQTLFGVVGIGLIVWVAAGVLATLIASAVRHRRVSA
jgi:hypothetical protein